jgi:prolyl oligopeptidase
MCAALQRSSCSEQPVLIRAERDAGHGSRAISRAIDLAADVLAFFAGQLGLPGATVTSPSGTAASLGNDDGRAWH